MNTDLLTAIRAFDATRPIGEATMPPGAWYTDPAFDQLERRHVFGNSWQFAATTAQLEAPGSWVGGCNFGIPWLLVRDGDGVLRGFHNSCRHKATPIAMGSGQAADGQLTCPYHGWRYHLDGRVKSAPRMAGLARFDREVMALPPLAVATWGPLVFIHLNVDAPPLAPPLTELQSRLDATGWSRLRYHSRRRYQLGCNWKVFADNYLDGGYHIAHMHPSLDAQLDMASYQTELFDTYSIQTSAPADGQDERITVDPQERIAGGALYAYVYPNLMINRYGPALDTNLVLPTGPASCEVYFDFWFDPTIADAEQFVAQSMAQSHVTQLEDIGVSESVQVGLGSPSYRGGPYAPQVESAEHHFHQYLSATYLNALNA